MEQCRGFLADEVDAAAVVDVVDVVPGDALCPVLLLQGETGEGRHEVQMTSVKGVTEKRHCVDIVDSSLDVHMQVWCPP